MTEYQWRYDEEVQIGTDYEDEREVEAYDRRMGQLRDFAAETAAAAAGLALAPDATVWEIGCGTGEVAIGLAGRCARVDATDISPVMLSYSARKAAGRGANNVFFHRGGFLGGYYPDRPVDGCLTQLALHHLPDAWKQVALHRIAAVLKPGGRFRLRDVVFADDREDCEAYFAGMVERMAQRATPEMTASYARHIRQEYSTFAWVIEGMMARAGLRVESMEDDGFLRTYMAVKR